MCAPLLLRIFFSLLNLSTMEIGLHRILFVSFVKTKHKSSQSEAEIDFFFLHCVLFWVERVSCNTKYSWNRQAFEENTLVKSVSSFFRWNTCNFKIQTAKHVATTMQHHAYYVHGCKNKAKDAPLELKLSNMLIKIC